MSWRTRGVVVLGLVALGGCVDAAERQCADGTLCPSDLACSTHGCVVPEQLDACDGAVDLTPCAYRDVEGGQCLDGVCVLVVCGDGEVAGDEACDDGNRVDGDGCAADCRSREGCGNGVRDVSEECDDGNQVDGDGCQADCALPECGDGVVDVALDEVCDDGNRVDGDGCAAACDSDESCGNGRRDAGEGCDDGNLTGGDGCQADCALPVCGDAVLDAGNLEACDDGNRIDGDGCSSDCRSDETCGNGVTDLGAGEPCDYGAGASGDGCDSTCALELPAWAPLTPSAAVAGRLYAAGAWSGSRGYAVVTGGLTSVSGSEASYAEGSVALLGPQVRPIAGLAPAPRYYHRLADCAQADAVVLFGGVSGDAAGYVIRGDTWLYDGAGWRDVTDAVGAAPPARALAALAADPATGEVVLFGGLAADAQTRLADTWRFDGAAWHQVDVPGPPARMYAALAADPQTGNLVLYGGVSTVNLTDTWIFDGTTWTEHLGPGPTVVDDMTLVRDPDGPGLLLLGTRSQTTQQRWRWADGGWTALPDVAGSEPTSVIVYDARRDRLVRFGGVLSTGPSTLQGTSSHAELIGDAWVPMVPADDPAPVGGAVGPAAVDVARGEVVLAAGGQGTWVWDAQRWRRVPGVAPTEDAAMAAVPADDALVAFGDYADARTWVWRGDGWSRAALAGPDVYSPTMAYDPQRAAVVLFGGTRNDSGFRSSATWLFDGATWTELATAGAPPGRSRAMMAYDPRGERVVLFGGVGNAALDDTWVLEGDTWRELTPATRPRARAWAGFGYLPARGTMVLASGNQNGGGPDLSDTWELDDETWRPVVTPTAVPRHALTTLVAAPWQASLLRLGGSAHLGDATVLDAWQFGFQPIVPSTAANVEACDALVAGDADGDGLVGCDDPDCAGRCYPLASAATAAAIALPYCGDGVCQLPREGIGACAADCAVCGDGLCAIGLESSTACPADCDLCGDGVCGPHEGAASCAADCP